MEPGARILLTVGVLLVAGLATDAIGRRTPVPRVTALLLLGILVGPIGLDVLPEEREQSFPIVATLALVMVGFLLGDEFTLRALRRRGRQILVLSAVQSIVTTVAVAVGLVAIGVDAELALPLGGIAAATAPAATVAVVQEAGASGRFTRVLLGVVALDDVWALLSFTLLIAVTSVVVGNGAEAEIVLDAGWEIGGAILLGLALGLPLSYLSGRVREGEPTLEEALGIVLVCAGLALWLEVSFLLSAVVLGATVANLAKHHRRPFSEIEHIEWPFLVLFFVLAGATLETEALRDIGVVGVAYVALRFAGKLAGAWVGGAAAGLPREERGWLGLALMPQAGVALGLALATADRFPEIADELLPVVVAATVVFELSGAVLTRIALERAPDPPDDDFPYEDVENHDAGTNVTSRSRP